MNYGASDRYQSEKGKEYLEYQRRSAPGAVLEARKFAPHIKSSDRVLDFGCGGGWILRQFHCAERVGVELNEAAHGFCRENGVRVHRTIADVDGRDFDVVISNHCLEHVPYPIDALRTLGRLLKAGGKLVLVVPLDDWRPQKDHTGRDIDHHLHTWTPRLLANTLVEAGFQVDRVDVLTYAWPPGWAKMMSIFPRWLFDRICWLTAVVKRRRQLLALATKQMEK